MEDVYTAPADSKIGYGGDKGFALVADWLDCIRTHRRDTRNGAKEMLATLELIDAIYESSRRCCRVVPQGERPLSAPPH
jgi:hypothetical protein